MSAFLQNFDHSDRLRLTLRFEQLLYHSGVDSGNVKQQKAIARRGTG